MYKKEIKNISFYFLFFVPDIFLQAINVHCPFSQPFSYYLLDLTWIKKTEDEIIWNF